MKCSFGPMAAFAIAIASTAPVSAQDPHAHHEAMEARGNQAMGFDQAKIRHTFTTAERGGAIEVIAKNPADADTIDQIRRHLREIAKLFKAGDFSKPLFIHAQTPPGTAVLTARRSEIDYRVDEMPAGGKVTISSANTEAIAGIHAFLRFQQDEHKK